MPAKLVDWQHDSEVLLIVTAAPSYDEVLQAVANNTRTRFGQCVFISANRPMARLRAELIDGQEWRAIHVVDCISGVTGIPPASDRDSTFVESPVMLEKTAMRASKMLTRMPAPAPLIVDSLSTFAIYNSLGPVVEITRRMTADLRTQQRGAAMLLINHQGPELLDSIASFFDRIVHV